MKFERCIVASCNCLPIMEFARPHALPPPHSEADCKPFGPYLAYPSHKPSEACQNWEVSFWFLLEPAFKRVPTSKHQTQDGYASVGGGFEMVVVLLVSLQHPPLLKGSPPPPPAAPPWWCLWRPKGRRCQVRGGEP